MTIRNRKFISQSFAVTEQQLTALAQYAQYASENIGQKVSVSEIVRLLIDQFVAQNIATSAQSNEPQSATIMTVDSTRRDNT
jgi:hypothetical protein